METMAAIPKSLTRSELRAHRAGFWLAMATNGVFFLTLVMTRLLVARGSVPAVVNQSAGFGLVVAMVISALVGRSSLRAMREDNRDGARTRLLVTALIGSAILIGGAVVWMTTPLPPTNLNVSSSLLVHYGPGSYPASTSIPHPVGLYGQIFFTLTGLVALESLIGVGTLWSHWIRGRFQRLSPGNYWGLEAAISFWGFMTVMWVAAYVVLYLV